MKKNPRFYFALFFAKATAAILRLLGRQGTSMPGSWAIILCPDFIGRMDKPKTIVGITGTNGKTTVANLIEDVLQAHGQDFICNRIGSNVPSGIATALIANSSLLGRQRKQLAIFELDERSAPRLFPYFTPTLLLVTNLFRDSYRRNAHTEFIYDLLNRHIPKGTTVLLNGDDPLCARLREKNERLFFGMLPQSFEQEGPPNLVCDCTPCPRCECPLTYDFRRYHHIGIYHCANCGYLFPPRDFLVETADLPRQLLTLRLQGTPCTVRLLDNSPTNIYNQLCALAVLSQLGYTPQMLQASCMQLQVTGSRLLHTTVRGKTLVRCLAKGQNPVACSRVFAMAQELIGQKSVILLLDDVHDGKKSVENTAWLWDTDFEFLHHPSITQIVVGGPRHLDTMVRLLVAGIDPACISHVESLSEVLLQIDFAKHDCFVLCHDLYLVDFAKNLETAMQHRLEGNNAD